MENDEKSYSFSEVLNICQENNIMPVADFHHQRCHKARKNLLDDILTNFSVIDQEIFEAIPEIIKLYRDRETLPTFHISSPLGGWDSSFKEQCRHADYINWKDYPQQLHSISALLKQDFILDVEAKAKEEAIFKLRDNLDKKIIN